MRVQRLQTHGGKQNALMQTLMAIRHDAMGLPVQEKASTAHCAAWITPL